MKRLLAVVQSGLLAARSPPRFSRCRMLLPEDAWTGLAPHMAAEAASLWSRRVVTGGGQQLRGGLNTDAHGTPAAGAWCV
jgi:hypothetical protein